MPSGGHTSRDRRLTYEEGHCISLLSGSLPDRAALRGVLERILDLNMKLISVTCSGPPTPYSDKEQEG